KGLLQRQKRAVFGRDWTDASAASPADLGPCGQASGDVLLGPTRSSECDRRADAVGEPRTHWVLLRRPRAEREDRRGHRIHSPGAAAVASAADRRDGSTWRTPRCCSATGDRPAAAV